MRRGVSKKIARVYLEVREGWGLIGVVEEVVLGFIHNHVSNHTSPFAWPRVRCLWYLFFARLRCRSWIFGETFGPRISHSSSFPVFLPFDKLSFLLSESIASCPQELQHLRSVSFQLGHTVGRIEIVGNPPCRASQRFQRILYDTHLQSCSLLGSRVLFADQVVIKGFSVCDSCHIHLAVIVGRHDGSDAKFTIQSISLA